MKKRNLICLSNDYQWCLFNNLHDGRLLGNGRFGFSDCKTCLNSKVVHTWWNKTHNPHLYISM